VIPPNVDRLLQPRHPRDFDAYYTGTPAWDIGHPQPAFQTLAGSGAVTGRVLDAGCGTGEHALMAAALGLAATGIDTAPAAVRAAGRKAAERGLSVRFLVGDALRLPDLGEQFDTVLDSGLFHVLDDADRTAFVESLAGAIPAGGRYFMLCFSEAQPGVGGPRRVSQAEIRTAFARGWRVDAIDAATMPLRTNPEGARAWFASITRIAG
jgi:SAM-dependent methyltransferase